MDRKAAIKEYGNLINQAREAKYRYNAKVEHRFDPTERDKELIREYHNLRAQAAEVARFVYPDYRWGSQEDLESVVICDMTNYLKWW
ncbi:MAG: hypothetical protein AABX64_02475 [Nanoarchaeota archaeon]